MTARRAISLLAGVALLGLDACGGGASKAPPGEAAPRLGMDVSRSASVDGVELRWWAASDENGAVGRAIAAGMDAEPVLTSPQAARWEEAGLRLVRMPRGEFDALARSAPPVGQFSREWKGWMGGWSPAFRGASIARAAVFMIDGQRTRLGPGAPRVLMRAWPAPTPQGPAVRLDIAFRFTDGESDASGGRTLDPLTCELLVDPGFVYILTSERPGVQWSTEKTGDTDSGAGGAGAGPAPDAGELLTIGELLFAYQGAGSGSAAPRKVIAVIVPEFSGNFALLRHRGAEGASGGDQ